jgi:hypothetical protein
MLSVAAGHPLFRLGVSTPHCWALTRGAESVCTKHLYQSLAAQLDQAVRPRNARSLVEEFDTGLPDNVNVEKREEPVGSIKEEKVEKMDCNDDVRFIKEVKVEKMDCNDDVRFIRKEKVEKLDFNDDGRYVVNIHSARGISRLPLGVDGMFGMLTHTKRKSSHFDFRCVLKHGTSPK